MLKGGTRGWPAAPSFALHPERRAAWPAQGRNRAGFKVLPGQAGRKALWKDLSLDSHAKDRGSRR